MIAIELATPGAVFQEPIRFFTGVYLPACPLGAAGIALRKLKKSLLHTDDRLGTLLGNGCPSKQDGGCQQHTFSQLLLTSVHYSDGHLPSEPPTFQGSMTRRMNTLSAPNSSIHGGLDAAVPSRKRTLRSWSGHQHSRDELACSLSTLGIRRFGEVWRALPTRPLPPSIPVPDRRKCLLSGRPACPRFVRSPRGDSPAT